MKKYNNPICDVNIFAASDVITASGFGAKTSWASGTVQEVVNTVDVEDEMI